MHNEFELFEQGANFMYDICGFDGLYYAKEKSAERMRKTELEIEERKLMENAEMKSERKPINCDKCLNSRPIVSENGMHYICALSAKKAKKCLLTGKNFISDRRIKDDN